MCLAPCLLFLTETAAWAGLLVKDDTGETIRLETPARRIIALYGAFNEILAAMGLEDRIVARTSADRLPESIIKKPSIDTHMRPNIELILGCKPDLVLQMAGRREASETVAALKRFGVSTAFFQVSSFEELFSVISRLGVLTEAELPARDLVTSMKSRLARVYEVVNNISGKPRVVFEVRYPNLLCAGRGSMVDEVIQKAGGVNCVTGSQKLIRLSEEELLRLSPDVYLVQKGPMNPAPLPPPERPHYQALEAVKKGRVYVVDEQMFSRPGPRNVEAVEILARRLYPDLFPGK
ncbi:MAG: ABC transporter substrate-binding protein [Pseudomonadota bacterium]